MARDDDDTTARDAAILGGGALLSYLLLRGFGGGRGLGGGGKGGRISTNATSAAAVAPQRPFCNVFIRGDRYELDGAPADFATAVASCRASGSAYVRASGDTR